MALKTNLLWIYEGEVPFDGAGGAFYPWYFSAWLVIQGRAVVSREGSTVTAEVGDWLIPWPGERDQVFDPGTRILSVRFQAHWPDGRSLFEQGLSITMPKQRFPEMESTARDLLSVVRPYIPEKDPTLLLRLPFSLDTFIDFKIALLRFVRSFASSLIASGLKPTRLGTHDERILAALQQLDFLPLNNKFRESDLARKIGLGCSQFVRLFRAEMGTTPKKYLEARKCEICRQMLSTSTVPLKEIALELGFAHSSDFSTWFKKNFHMAPASWRKLTSRKPASI